MKNPIASGVREHSALSDAHLTHIAASEYSYRVPTPPRIIIPPPMLNGRDQFPQFSVGTPGQIDLGFLDAYDLSRGSLVKSNVMNEWRYERRRAAQEILPFVWLGPMGAVKDREFLKKEGITMVLAVKHRTGLQSKLMGGAVRIAMEEGLEAQALELADNAELIAAFPKSAAIINAHLSKIHRESGAQARGKVLVFCESGNERSAAVVAAYLMEMFKDVDHLTAMSICQSQRFCANFDDPLKHLLLTYWELVQARRDVTIAPPDLSAGFTGQGQTVQAASEIANKSKRRVSEAYDDEMSTNDAMDLDDEARFNGRRNFTPFQDAGA